MREKGWRRGSESNRRIKVLQTSPLPLGYRAPALANSVPKPSWCVFGARASWKQRNLERETGFEPATSTLARSHSTTELLPPCKTRSHYIALKMQGQTALHFGSDHRIS